MDFNREGKSTNKPPLLDGTNYAYWIVRMSAFLKAIDDHVWDTVEEGYADPTVVVDGQIVKKPRAQWTADEKTKSNYNNQAINVIYNRITPAEFNRIYACPTAKAAWELLQTIHEGTDTVKQTKLQNLTTAFETTRIKILKCLMSSVQNLVKL